MKPDVLRASIEESIATKRRLLDHCLPAIRALCEQAVATLRAGDRLVVCGSFHTVGPALEWLDERDAEPGETA